VTFGVWSLGLMFCCSVVLVLWCFGALVPWRCGVLAFEFLVSAWCGFAWGVRRSGWLLVLGGLA
jgi:hypothetical protein